MQRICSRGSRCVTSAATGTSWGGVREGRRTDEARPMRLVAWQPEDLLRRLADGGGGYGEAMGSRAELLQTRRGYIGAHVRRAGFRAVATLTTEGRLAGFGYGYTPGPGPGGQDQVRSALDEPARRHWLGDCFEVVELHVKPSAQGHG